MRKWVGLLCLICMIVVGGWWIVRRAIGQATSFVRKINGLPAGQHWWFVDAYQGQLFVIDRYGNKVDITGKINLYPVAPFYVARINPNTEQVEEEFTTRQWRAVAISAQREQRVDSWLTQDYDYWVLDSQSNTAYALRPTHWDEWGEERYTGIYVIDVQTRQLKKFLEISPIGTLSLSSSEGKLYVSVGPEYGKSPEIRVFSTATLDLIKTMTYNSDCPIWDMKFTRDGKRLFCCVYGRGLLVVNTVNDQFESWGEPLDVPVDFGLANFSFSIAMASDEKEVYVALRDSRERGRVAAIDIAQKKLVRTLELSPTACTSVVVIGDKLFAACLDGVYVIDIPAWRQQ
ncbi:hypothetical protein HRbin17_02055 [bacterium HR17]|uniref:Uncharacterized protein n=1 Tax=Candidatus Fervidibacter japonicus TaxID=2035412 RepID=A0A2H5XEC1_9BACT|nr:hypothetical protein HRbin17_02055 [bacterium HR17]